MLVTAVAGFGFGLALLAVGLRGRRTDDHPLCRRCRFDLTGKPADSTRCPECGADLARPRAVRVGHRRRRPALLVSGTVLLLAIAWPAVDGAARVRRYGLAPYEPAWWLRRDLAEADPGRSAVALDELFNRMLTGRLSPAQVSSVADALLAKQASPVPWDNRWGRFIEAARMSRQLDPGRWATYARQGVAMSVETARDFWPGDAPSLDPQQRPMRMRSAVFTSFFEMTDVRIDGRLVTLRWPPFDRADYAGHQGRFGFGPDHDHSYAGPSLGVADTAQLTVGRHTLTAAVRLWVYDDGDLDDGGGGSPHRTVPRKPPLCVLDIHTSSSFKVHAPPVLVADAARRAAVRAAVTDVVVQRTDHVVLSITINNPPVCLAFTAWVRPAGSTDGRWVPLPDPIVWFPGGSFPFTIGGAADLSDAARADVALRPAPEWVPRWAGDAIPVWGEPVIIRDVAIQ